MGRFLLTSPAKEDIRQIVRYIRQDNPDAAAKVRTKLKSAMQRLADFPEMGHIRSDLADEAMRVWSVYSYLIIYRSERKPLEVLRVVHGARELSQGLEGLR